MMVTVRGLKGKHVRGEARADCGWAKTLRGCFAFLVLLLESLTVGNAKAQAATERAGRRNASQ